MMAQVDQAREVETLNTALRLFRRLVLRVFLIVIGGFALAIALGMLGTALSPPYGVYIAGEGLGTWGLIATVVALIGEIWWDGHAIGRALNDPVMKSMPAIGMLSVTGVIAQRANAIGMEWTGFFGPLRPQRRK